jgi:Tol biopolymer transport system component
VAFLVTNAVANISYLYRYDRLVANATLVASNTATRFTPAFSGDARYLAYASGGALYVYDHQNGSNHLASACTSGGEPLTNCLAPSFSADGSRVTFLATQAGIVSAWVYDLATDCTQLVSLNTNGTSTSTVPSSYPAIGRDGRTVVFESLAADLVAADYNQSVDVFVRNLEDGTTKLISRRAESLPTFSGMRPVAHTPGSFSADGRVMAFSSWDRELTEADPNTGIDLFIRDLPQGTIRRVDASSVTTHAGYPSVNADGRYVAYLQNWTNMLWMDLATGVSRFVEEVGPSKPTLGRITATGPLISPDGRLVAYAKLGSGGYNVFYEDILSESSTAVPVTVRQGSSTLLPGTGAAPHTFSPDGKWLAFGTTQWLGTNQPAPLETYKLYVRRLETAEMRHLSVGATVTNAIFSADSRFVFFHNYTFSPPTFSSMMVARHDLSASPSNQIICRECWNPSPSSDGQLVALQTFNSSLGANATNDVFVLNLANGQSNLVSVNFSGTSGGNGNSGSPAMSYDGRYVAFISKANNLVPNDTNNAADIFLRDLQAGTTLLVSRSFDGTQTANGVSFAPILSADGRTVFFSSFASDLDPGDFNQARDIFALKLAGPDADHDGMDDNWEMAYFNTLDRDGSGDFDADGQTDLEEFRAGTNPANNESILRVLTVASMSGGGKTLLWAAAPGRKYQAQFKAGVDEAGWTDLPGVVTAAGTTGSKADSTASGEAHRFYRVMLVP